MIEVKNLKFDYIKTKKEAIRGIDFSVKKGEIFGFLGPSGAGKTTTQKIITGLLRGYKGSVNILGKERKQWGNEFYENIGVAFEFPNLYLKLTAYENLQVFGSYYKNKLNDIDVLLDRVNLSEDKNKRTEAYSKGMKMRLNFVRSILHNPDIVFLDEPTSGLDPVNAKIIKDFILELKEKGTTIFLTTHNMTVADQLCDRVAFIVDGDIKLINSPDTLKQKYGTQEVIVKYIEDNEEKDISFQLNGIGSNTGFLKVLKDNKIKTIHSNEATLEDIFIKVTGRGLL